MCSSLLISTDTQAAKRAMATPSLSSFFPKPKNALKMSATAAGATPTNQLFRDAKQVIDLVHSYYMNQCTKKTMRQLRTYTGGFEASITL